MPEQPEWLTVVEAARRMGVSVQAVRARVRRGSLEARRDNRGRTLVRVVGELPTEVASPEATLREQVARLEERVANADALRAREVARLEAHLADLQRRLDEGHAERARLLALLEAELARRRRRRTWPGVAVIWRRFWRGGG